jgi:hypothetical protein
MPVPRGTVCAPEPVIPASRPVIPAKAGIHKTALDARLRGHDEQGWMPACVGMTGPSQGKVMTAVSSMRFGLSALAPPMAQACASGPRGR